MDEISIAPALRIEVILLPGGAANLVEKDGSVAVIIDVLRASSTVLAALRYGANGVVSFPSVEEARRFNQNAPPNTTLLVGERGGIPPEGFDLGNSPGEYTPERLCGKTVVLSTTNGSMAMDLARGATHRVWGCFRNASTVVRFLRNPGVSHCWIVCAGLSGEFSLEDALAAGMIVSLLYERSNAGPLSLSDSAEAVRLLYRQAAGDLFQNVMSAQHARTLVRLGFAEDISYCCDTDADDGYLPILRDGVAILW